MATLVPVSIVQGSDYSDTLTLTDGNGAALNLTGWTITSQIRRASGYSILATFTVTVSAPTTGVVYRNLTGAVTSTIPVPFGDGITHFHDVLGTRGDGVKIRLIQGPVTVDPQITK